MKIAMFAAAFLYYVIGFAGFQAMASCYHWTPLLGLLLWTGTFGFTVGITTLVCFSWESWTN